jgi:type IV pilus assembly protein PilN
VTVNGYAQSQERVSELLRNMSSASPWLERPDLVEVKAGTIGQGKVARKVVEFSVIVGIKRPRDKDKPEDDGKPAGKPAAAEKAA